MSYWSIHAGERIKFFIQQKGVCYKCSEPIEELKTMIVDDRHSKVNKKYESYVELEESIYKRLGLHDTYGTSKEVCKPLPDAPEMYEKVTIWYHYKCPEKKE